MCRHLAWLGAPRTLSSLILEHPAGLLQQSWAPRRQRHGVVNADGWGVGFWAAGRDEPVRWRSSRPLWQEQSFASVAPLLSSGAVIAAVRDASVGMPLDETATAPFTDGRWLVSHNGRVDRAALPQRPEAESTCDAAILAAHVLAEGVDRLGDTVRKVAAADPDARLTLLLTDGERVLGTTWGEQMCYLEEPDGTVVASEPWDDDPRWVDVPHHHLIEVTRDAVTVIPLEP